MADPIVWTDRASTDIEAIVRYISRRNPKAAESIGLGIYNRAQILLAHPQSGTFLDELRDGGWRKLVYRRWIIIYTIRDETIIVGRVWPVALGDADFETPLE
jgi:plasmid stabilization system protein ParE